MEDLHALCRACGTTINKKLDTKLFDKLNYYMVSLIDDITDIWIEHDENLPEYICIGCKCLLDQVVEFRAKCLTNQKRLVATINMALGNGKDCNAPKSLQNLEADTNLQLSEDNIELKMCGQLARSKAANVKCKQKHSTSTWICEQCGGEFKSSTYLKLHMLRHTDNKPYECDICHRRYYTHNEMLRHRLLHTSERPYKCRFCNKSFRGTSSKAVHERTHTNERPFSCKYCEKTFTSTSVCKMHERVHDNNRQYYCEPCNQWFVRSTHLTTHQRTKLHKTKSVKES
ncbi:transcription factor Ouib-like [Drosophila busckii]|uniref:transcription factor Ouib-like n=1 Tax=Drosophila busckii TaxID=30019 RepID=UPI00083F379D|nr:transcription factor Ouib-like [Drosophila busckii]